LEVHILAASFVLRKVSILQRDSQIKTLPIEKKKKSGTRKGVGLHPVQPFNKALFFSEDFLNLK